MRRQTCTISEVTRRAIADRVTAGHFSWAGRFSEDDFLSRLYDLSALPSHDHRFSTAAGDISQHRVSWQDWDDDWIFYDSRFNLMRCSDEEFLRFLAETVHPVVRSDPEETERLVSLYNNQLKADDWELVPEDEISGRPVFAARKVGRHIEVFPEPTGWARVDRQMDEIRLRVRQGRTEEQFQAVGHLCREVLISLAQAVYDRSRHPPLDRVEPSTSDAKRMLEAFFAVELAGSRNESARRHARAAFDFANSVQHDQNATFQNAALCAEAALSVARIAAIVSDRRERMDLRD
jgi:AbiJ N-terminal domain 3